MLLSVEDLKVSFKTNLGEVQAVQGVSFNLEEGETIAIVGESGCGKSAMAHSIMKLIPTPPGCIAGGQIFFDGQDLLLKNEKEMRKIRGGNIAMIFQESVTSLNPTLKIGSQILEALKKRGEIPAAEQRQRAMEMFSMAGLPDPVRIFKQYPHQLSGGMRQRVMIAIALAGNPRLLIADEPTTALDVTIQAQIMELLHELRHNTGKSIILITHDLGLAAGFASRVMVMYAGKIVENGTARDIFYHPGHPYTRGLLAAVPRPGQERLSPIPGRSPDLINPPQGCAFWPRCGQAMLICQQSQPPETIISDLHRVRCWLAHHHAVGSY
ncbi:MAG: ABC transporter ATP-binding protein [Desulfotomaculaceae bacterium]